MKYFSCQSVADAYKNFQNCMTNKSWGYLALLKECGELIKPSTPYQVSLNDVSNFLEGLFNLNESKKTYDGEKSLYVVFSNQWKDFFNAQGHNTPNIYDVAIWAFRRSCFEDTIDSEKLLAMFATTFNIPTDVLNACFNNSPKSLSFVDFLYSEAELKSELQKNGVDVSKNIIDAQNKSVVANPGEISRGPFIQPLYAGLDITDYVMILQSDYADIYGTSINTNAPTISYSLDELVKFYRDLVMSEYSTAGNAIFMVIYGSRVKELKLTAADIYNRAGQLFPEDKAKFRSQELNHAFKLYDYFLKYPDKMHLPAIPSKPISTLLHHSKDIKNYDLFLTALRVKPFLLLAGISGTGKSQKVQELAFMTCPDNELRDPNSTTPGNYQLIEVKPNWHDSTELLGYYSALSGKYELTDFIRFTYKAIMNPDVPFFLCLDEMNLAPVEQYFAEFLSVLETRKKVGDQILTQPLLSKDKFANCKLQEYILTEEQGVITKDGKNYNMKDLYSPEDTKLIEYMKENGLHLPDNLFVIGTVNMDDTTHQFSRKVIDRAFTIEMNGGKMSEMFTDASKMLLEYRDDPVPLKAFKSRFVRAYEVLDDGQFSKYAEQIRNNIPELLGDSDGTAAEDSINGILNNTPFRVSYRVQNELVLYLSVLIENAGFPDDIDNLIGEATLAILLEKVLPRVQGEQKQLETQGGKSNILKDLKAFVEKHFAPKADEKGETKANPLYTKVIKKLEEMDKKLSGYYTNFF